jgi:hypothetical protein
MAYDAMAGKLVGLFVENFSQYADGISQEVLAAGPKPIAKEKTGSSGG